MIWFTADWHLDHLNILKYCNRPFKDVNQMNEIIINNYNSVVKENDIAYFLGDFAFKNVAEFSKRLNGVKYLLLGSHDKPSKTFGEFNILESIYEFYPPNLLDEYGNKRLIVLCHWAMRSWSKSHYASWHLYGHCVDTETELLTEDGFVSYNNIQRGKMALTLNIYNNKLEYKPIRDVFIYDNAPTVHFKNKSGSMVLTLNHQILGVSTYKGAFYFESAEKAFNRTHLIIPIARNSDGTGFDKNLAFFQLLGLIISEGHFHYQEYEGGNGITIYQKTTRKKFISNILLKTGALFRTIDILGDMTKFYIPAKWVIENIYPWITGKRLSPKLMMLRDEQFRALLSGLIFGDGSIISKEINKEEFCNNLIHSYPGKSICTYYSANKDLIDTLSILCILNGYGTHVAWKSGGFKSGGYYLIISNRQNVQFRKSHNVREYFNSRRVWCINTENETMVVRRNGFTFVTGNSHGRLEPHGLSFDVGVDTNNFYPYSLIDIKRKMRTLKPIIDFRKNRTQEY